MIHLEGGCTYCAIDPQVKRILLTDGYQFSTFISVLISCLFDNLGRPRSLISSDGTPFRNRPSVIPNRA